MNLNFITKKDNSNSNLNFSDFDLIKSNKDFSMEKYVCVSYAWNNKSIQHPYLLKNINISDRTLDVLKTALRAYNKLLHQNGKDIPITDNFWLDSLCIPADIFEKEQHHFLMGEIYAKSSIVIVVFSKEMNTVLNKIRNSIALNDEDFLILNNDRWVSRYWTYQEIVNAGIIYFTSEQSFEDPIFASDFFDRIANDIETYTKTNNLESLDFQKRYPFLTSLEAVILDWRIMKYQERSVYQVMVNMEYRTSDIVSSKIKAMFGCISGHLLLNDYKNNNDYETFLNLCNIKEDYSFIFNTSLKRNKLKKRWCPEEFDFQPIYSWLFCYGNGQEGKLNDEILELYNLIIKQQYSISDGAIDYLNKILNSENETSKGNIKSIIEANLRSLNFTGTYNPIELENGYYFNQFSVESSENISIAICTGVKWAFGAPAILIEKTEKENIYSFLSSGVFFGKINQSEISPNVLKLI